MARFVVFALAAVVLGWPAMAQQGELAVHGSVRSRVELWDWFDAAGNSSYAFSGNTIRLNVGQTGKRVDWFVEAEAPLLFGLPSDSVAAGAPGQLGLGGNYYAANDRQTNAAMVFLKQGFLRHKSGRHSMRIGRFEFSEGAEVPPADPSVGWLKRERIAQRIIGPFGWSHVGRAFDGAQYVWSGKNTNVTAIGVRPMRGAFQVDGWGEMDIALGYAAVTRSKGTSDWRVFGVYYDDWRNVVKTDNRPAALRNPDRDAVRVGSAGGHYLRAAGRFDLMAWGIAQFGRWGVQSHRAYAVAAEAGWQPAILPKLRPWLRGGYYRGSGDDTPGDGRHSTFFQMLPTPRPYARTPFFNMMNNEDLMAMLIVRPHKAVSIRAEAHGLRLAARNDLWYTGGGAFQPWTFGYAGRPSGGSRDLAALYDVSAEYTVNARWSLNGYFGHVRGGDVIRPIYPAGTKANFGYLEANYKF